MLNQILVVVGIVVGILVVNAVFWGGMFKLLCKRIEKTFGDC